MLYSIMEVVLMIIVNDEVFRLDTANTSLYIQAH
jgi:hypothetical protein